MTHQRNRGGFNRHIAAATHGNSDIGLSQRRCIVNTVTHHGNLTPLALQTFNRLGFTVRQNTGNHLINTGFFGNSVSRGRVVTSKHHQTIPVAVQALKCCHAVATQRITHR